MKKPKRIDQKRISSKERTNTVFIRGQQNFDKFETSNPIQIKVEKDTVLRKLQKYCGGAGLRMKQETYL